MDERFESICNIVKMIEDIQEQQTFLQVEAPESNVPNVSNTSSSNGAFRITQKGTDLTLIQNIDRKRPTIFQRK